jgi:PAS domain-containing protein
VFEDNRLCAAGLLPYVNESAGGVAVTTPLLLYDPAQTQHKGHPRWLRGFVYPVKDETGCVLELALVLEDLITERKRAEARIEASEVELQALFAAMDDVILMLDAQGHYFKVAPTNPSLLYKPAAKLIGKPLHEVLRRQRPISSKVRSVRCSDGIRPALSLPRMSGLFPLTPPLPPPL